jgi:hypothetical protein
MSNNDTTIYTAGAQGTRPIFAKVKCPHCAKDIEIVIAGMAILPSNSEVIKFSLEWIEHGTD